MWQPHHSVRRIALKSRIETPRITKHLTTGATMKTKPAARLLAATLLTGALLLYPVQAVLAASVTLSWSFNYSVDPGCASTSAKNCVTGFEYGTTPDNGVTLNKIGTVSNPSPIPTGPANGITVAFQQGPPYGSVVYYVRTVGTDGNGNPVFSAEAHAQPVKLKPRQHSNDAVYSKT
jgi:hypothetical protein